MSHTFDPGWTGMSTQCNTLVLRDGYGDDCGLPKDHPTHRPFNLPLHRTEAGYPNCSTCDGGGCLDCTDPA